MSIIAGIDLGGTAINYTLLDANERFLIEGLCEHPALTRQGPTVCLQQIEDGLKIAAAKAGVADEGEWSTSAGWFDYDKDGCVDLFVGRYVKFDPKYRAFYAPDGYPGPLDYAGETNKLFHNNCDGTFTDVTDKSGIGADVGRTMGVTAADFDNDGWDDIYVSNDRTENFLFRMASLLRLWDRFLPTLRGGDGWTCGSQMGATTVCCATRAR